MNNLNNQKGIAMVIALMVLLVIALMSATIMLTVTNEYKIGGNQMRYTQSMAIAEAGVGEVLARMRNGEIGDPGGVGAPSASWRGTVFNAASAPTAPTGENYYATLQLADSMLDYATGGTSEPAADRLTIRHKLNSAGVVVYYNPIDGEHTGYNAKRGDGIVEIIEATGYVGNNKRRLIMEVVHNVTPVIVTSALAAGGSLSGMGANGACGHNHRAMPGTGNAVAMVSGAQTCNNYHICNNPPVTPAHPICADAGCLSGLRLGGTNGLGGNPNVLGTPAVVEHDATPIPQPWEILNKTQAWWDALPWDAPTVAWKPIRKIAGDYSTKPGVDSGFVYCSGNATVTGRNHFVGVLYAENEIDLQANCWYLGAMVGRNAISTANSLGGNCDIMYSSQAISKYTTDYTNSEYYTTLSWREK